MAKAVKGKSLVIVESPAKAKTINKYLGGSFEVKASMGHIRDLPSKGINVDIENNFEPTYDITPGRKKMVNTLKSSAKKCDQVYLATDLDREGEAIAWHLKECLGLKDENTYRVVFNAITKNAIEKAFENPGKIDMDRVMAQQARRILDRIVGYQISPLLWKKVARGLSAGRVQSVAVKIIVLREREIRAFNPEEYWLMPAVFTPNAQTDLASAWQEFLDSAPDADKGRTLIEQDKWLAEHGAFKAELISVDSEKFHVDNQKDAEATLANLEKATYAISDIITRRVKSKPAPPFITSTLQQAAANRMGFAAKRTMRVAQQLYEGIDLGSMGALGLITYMRTDSTHLSNEAIDAARHFISGQFGPDYLPEKPNRYASKKGAQEAHEAVRPTDPDLTPDDIKQFLSDEQYKLYNLIWQRFIACQMAAAQWDTTRVEISGTAEQFSCRYRTTGRVLVFDGFTRVWPTGGKEPQLPAMQAGNALTAVDIKAKQHFTKPPARYTEASLVKALEKEGIGRPSTYASIISTIQDRKYVEQLERKFHATDIGEVVTDKLDEFFPQVMDVALVLNEFYGPFSKKLEEAAETMKHAKAETQPSDYTCPECQKPMVYRFGKNGRFLSCSDYPTCKYACPCDREGKMVEQVESEHKCPNCSKPLIEKTGRFGTFLGCSGYPECKTILKMDADGNPLPPPPPPEPTGVRCYKCKDGELVIRQSKRGPFMGCNRFPRCRTIVSMKKLDELKDLQEQGKWPPKDIEEGKAIASVKKEPKKTKKKTAKKKTAKKKVKKKAVKAEK
ncbi:MAG: type I DNA topoisomerase [Planctomycetota bacterium]|jgi:DNA topoisomerase-1